MVSINLNLVFDVVTAAVQSFCSLPLSLCSSPAIASAIVPALDLACWSCSVIIMMMPMIGGVAVTIIMTMVMVMTKSKIVMLLDMMTVTAAAADDEDCDDGRRWLMMVMMKGLTRNGYYHSHCAH